MKYLNLHVAFLIAILLQISFGKSAKQKFAEFVDSTFAYFKLTDTSAIIACFSDNEANTFFHWLNTLQLTDSYLSDGKLAAFTSSRLQLTRYQQTIAAKAKCAFPTGDFAKLLTAIGLPPYFDVYYQWENNFGIYNYAFPRVIADSLREPVALLNKSNDTAAGTAFAPALLQLSSQITPFAVLMNSVQAFYNGWFATLGLPTPSGLTTCLQNNDSSIQHLVEFYSGWATAIQNNFLDPQANLTNVTEMYFNGAGAKSYHMVTPSIISCMTNSQNGTAFKAATGFTLDPLDQDFINGVYNVIGKNKTLFQTEMLLVATDFRVNLYFEAGLDVGRIVNLKRMTEEFWMDEE